VVGTAVNDVIHLVAELVENATTFSPPTTRIEIRADSVGNGFAVEIEDRGLGLPAGELAEINQRLADPPEFDLANSDQLGLFVVGQLAGRHGITVSLRDSPYGGTTAIVLMPHSLIVRADETAQPAMATASTTGPAGPDRAGTREQGATFSLTGRHQPGGKSPEAPADLDPGRWLPAQARLHPQAQEQAAEPTLPPREPAPPAAPSESPGPTFRGLPRRVRQASLAPQLREHARTLAPADRAAPASVPLRSPEENRDLMSTLQQGWRRGRVDDLDDWPGGLPGAAADSSDGEAPG
jgi:hypothetical protein